jgi:hypothetical protein
VFTVVDDGRGQPEDYIEAERLVSEQARAWPEGLGCVVVVPAGAHPLAEETRKAIDGVLTRLSSRLKALVWVVEGTGFKAAATRAVVMGLALYGKRAYPTQVSSSIADGLAWLLPRVPRDGRQRKNDASIEIAETIARVRAEWAA